MQMVNKKVFFDLFGVAQRIDDAAAPEGIVDELCSAFRFYGFSACLITRLPVPHVGRWDEHILVNSWPGEWYTHYNLCGHYRHDPCAERSRRTADPFFWSQLDRHSMAPAGQKIMNEATEFGLREGVCVPIHSPFAEPSVVTISGEHTDIAPNAIHAVDTLARHGLRALSKWANKENDPDAALLTEREREILQWIGAGKTAWEISCILGISFHTVNTHLRNVRQKFGATNITHCLVEALRKQEIQL